MYVLNGRGSVPSRAAEALYRCDTMIGWYENKLTFARRCYYVFQSAVILLSGITPFLVLTPYLADQKALQALPATVAAIAAALITSYRWREDWVRYAVAAETLRSERIKFGTRTTEPYAIKLTDDDALDNFVFRIEALAISEVAEWRSQIVQKANDTTGSPPAGAAPLAQASR